MYRIRLPVRCRALFMVLVSQLLGYAAAPKEFLTGVDDKWRHLTSPNFEIYSHNSDSDSRALLHHLELLRAVFLERFKFVERARLNVTVYYFRNREEFHAYASEQTAKHGGFAGFYQHSPDRAVISIGPIGSWAEAQPLVFHEYVHHLFRTSGAEPAPWFNEGMAELLASIRVSGNTIEIGHPHLGRIQALREGKLLPLETLFTTTYQSSVFKVDEHTGIFYAEAWALLHYWYFGDSGIAREAVNRFTRVAGQQTFATLESLRPLFQQCFGMDYPEMQKKLERYVETGRYRYGRQPLPIIPAAKTYSARALPRHEIRVRLAELALRIQRAPAAKFILLDALAQTSPAGGAIDARILEVLGTDEFREGEMVRAAERWEEAVVAGSRNPALIRELVLLESRNWFKNFDLYFQLSAETAERLRTRLLRAIQHEPEQSASYEMLAWVEAFAERPVVQNVNLVQQRFSTLQERARTLLALSLVRVRTQEPLEALEMLDQLDGMRPDAWTMHAAQMVRTKLAGVASQRKRGDAPAPKPLAESDLLQPRVRVPSVELPDKYSGR